MSHDHDGWEVIMSRRSIRKWQDKTISRDTLNIIMKHGINAPNGKGIHAYEVRVIDKPELLKENNFIFVTN